MLLHILTHTGSLRARDGSSTRPPLAALLHPGSPLVGVFQLLRLESKCVSNNASSSSSSSSSSTAAAAAASPSRTQHLGVAR